MPNRASTDSEIDPEPGQAGGRRAVRKFKLLEIVTATALLAVCLLTSIGVIFVFLEVNRVIKGVANLDFVEYWAAGQLFDHGGNPYSAAAILALERSVGFTIEKSLVSGSPPTVLLLVAPLGLLNAKAGVVFWALLLAGSLAMSIRLLWIRFGRRPDHLHLLCFCSASALLGLMSGQIGILLLLAVSLFLYLHERNPFLSGVALALLSVKPHLFLPFGLVVVFWSVFAKRYRVLTGFLSALIFVCALTTVLDVHVWSQYQQMMREAQLSDYPVFTLSRELRIHINPGMKWLQYLPTLAGCIWGAWYFWRSRKHWDWMKQGLLLLAVSIVCASYSWHTDEAILIPAIMAALYRSQENGRSLLPFALIAGTELAELLKGFWMDSPYYLWTAPAWLAWYLFASRRANIDTLQHIEELV